MGIRLHVDGKGPLVSLEHSPAKLCYSIREAMEATSVGRSFLYSEIAAGRLLTIKVGARTLIAADDLKAWLELWAERSAEATVA